MSQIRWVWVKFISHSASEVWMVERKFLPSSWSLTAFRQLLLAPIKPAKVSGFKGKSWWSCFSSRKFRWISSIEENQNGLIGERNSFSVGQWCFNKRCKGELQIENILSKTCKMITVSHLCAIVYDEIKTVPRTEGCITLPKKCTRFLKAIGFSISGFLYGYFF